MIKLRPIGISPPCKWDQTARRTHFSSRARLREGLAIGQCWREAEGQDADGILMGVSTRGEIKVNVAFDRI